MVTAQPHYQDQDPLYMSEAEYLEFEDQSDIRHEYINGRVKAMAGATWNHTVINGSIQSALDALLLDTACVVVSNEIKLKVESKKVSYRYPDLMVVCDEPKFLENRTDIITNPTIVVEILSPSTALEDHNEKLDEYTRIDSIQEYLLISQNEAKIERYLRQESGDWLYSNIKGIASCLVLPSIDVTLEFSFIYKKLSLKHEGDE